MSAVNNFAPGLHMRDQPAIYRGPLAACSALIRQTAQGGYGWAFHSEECPLLPTLARCSHGKTTGRSLHRRTLMNGSGSSLISQDSTARGNLFFGKKIPLSSHLQLPVTVTVIFSRQPILMRFSPLSFMRCQHFSGENNVKIQQITRQLFESVCKFQSL